MVSVSISGTIKPFETNVSLYGAQNSYKSILAAFGLSWLHLGWAKLWAMTEGKLWQMQHTNAAAFLEQ